MKTSVSRHICWALRPHGAEGVPCARHQFSRLWSAWRDLCAASRSPADVPGINGHALEAANRVPELTSRAASYIEGKGSSTDREEILLAPRNSNRRTNSIRSSTPLSNRTEPCKAPPRARRKLRAFNRIGKGFLAESLARLEFSAQLSSVQSKRVATPDTQSRINAVFLRGYSLFESRSNLDRTYDPRAEGLERGFCRPAQIESH